MARYIGALCKLCRREGEKLFLKGSRCFTEKCGIEHRKYAPGQHGQSRKNKVSDYGIQLREKQKVRRMYGIMERQFRLYFEKASKMKGVTGELLIQLLERRLDNVVYRMGFAINRRQARGIISHGHIRVNSKKVDIPSYLLKAGDMIEVKESTKSNPIIIENIEISQHKGFPEWIELDSQGMKAKFIRIPTKEEIRMPIEEKLIVELYSK